MRAREGNYQDLRREKEECEREVPQKCIPLTTRQWLWSILGMQA